MYKYEPTVFKDLLNNGTYNQSFSADIDPYYLRTPLFRLIGKWDPAKIKVFKERRPVARIQ